MIIINIGGGIGNQLFQCALGLHLANKLNTELILAVQNYNSAPDKKAFYEDRYALDNFSGNFKVIDYSELQISEQEKVAYFRGQRLTLVRETRTDFIPEILNCPDNALIIGTFQSYKYFKDVSELVLKNFTFKGTLHRVSEFWKEEIYAAECSVALHIRRSSYMRPIFRGHAGILSLQYYQDCVNTIKKVYPNITVFVFSNDLDWARQNLKLGVPTKFVEGCETDIEEFYLMTLCTHNVIANSTYSWWGAWLNKNPQKMVLAPALWARSHWGGDTVCPPEWIKLPSKFETNEPALSFIIFLQNDLSDAEKIFNCILNQNFYNYEIIAVSTADSGGEFSAHRHSVQKNFMVLNADSETTKESAWNLGLKCAHGEYIIFLTGKDIISNNVARLVCDCWDFASQDYLQRDNYLTAENRAKFTPNIIWGSKHFTENPHGAFNVQGIDNKKFSLSEDLQLNSADRFFNLSTTAFNEFISLFNATSKTVIGSKIFKRKFLLDNNISFNEKSARAEMLFLLNALLLSEKVTITTELFLVQLN